MKKEETKQSIMDLMRRDNSTDAPTDSIKWASDLFRTRAAAPRRTIVQKLAGILQMEIAPNKPAFGERSASTSQVRQLLFRAGDNAVDLRIEPKGKVFTVRGQILGDGCSAARVTLSNDTYDLGTQANEMCEFVFEDVTAGRYELLIHGESFDISLKTIDIE
jgi:hypothetical protein